MSNRKELRLTVPCGFAAKNGAQLTFTEVKSRPGDAISIDKLSEDQKRKLTIDCWNHGFWDDIFIDGRRLTKSEAIDAVENFKDSGELGYELVQITMAGYAHIYKSFLPHDEEKWPLVKLIGKPELKESVILQQVTPFRINNLTTFRSQSISTNWTSIVKPLTFVISQPIPDLLLRYQTSQDNHG